MRPLTWIHISGGLCRYGDRGTPRNVPSLSWTCTPLTYGQLGWTAKHPDLPVTRLAQAAAAGIAADLGGRLPTSAEWEWMAAGPQRRHFPWGDTEWQHPRAALAPAGHRRPGPVGSYPDGATPEGMLDVAGNVWEWTATPLLGDGHIIRGGSYASAVLYAKCTFLNAAPAELCSPGIGLRVVKLA
ncbi:formylglycine-generating enzyme family protein [Actinoplanes sp. NPDC051859]|uniref:formylglycine-generating enzyme family protein n=1 Tax=Actinoplanes sp. NPDC051859 TaxID=3363909 RepID=UPI0037B57285